MVCTFFGHHSTNESILPNLEEVLTDLIENKNVDTFYVGHQGNFDTIVRRTLRSLKEKYPFIKYYVVLAYLPTNKNKYSYEDFSDTIYPDGLEEVHPKFAISKRNEWLVKSSDIVVTCVSYSLGGAASFKAMAERKGKIVINLT
ncbi:MAG: hypothetical protein IKT56_01980 [Clostridia bacterium]|nr:hypothetical protein [Clostridia bacterium]